MTTCIFNDFNAERLVASTIILHEVSSHDELIPQIPLHLKRALGASSVSMILVGLTVAGIEIARTVHPAGTAQHDGTPPAEPDWVSDLLAQRTANPALSPTNCRIVRFLPDGRTQALFNLDPEHAVAFDIHTPAAIDALTDNGRQWLLALLGQVISNLHARIQHPDPATRRVAPLNLLTDREWHVLLAIDCDASEREIAAAMNMSAHTLHAHIKNIYRMLQVKSRLGAMAILHRAQRHTRLHDLLPPTDSSRPAMQPPITLSPRTTPHLQRLVPRHATRETKHDNSACRAR